MLSKKRYSFFREHNFDETVSLLFAISMLLLLLIVSTVVKSSQTACVWATINKCAEPDPLEVCQERVTDAHEKLPAFVKTPRDDGVEWVIVHYKFGHSFHIRNPRDDFKVCCNKHAHWELGKKWRSSGFKKHARLWKECRGIYNQEHKENQQLSGQYTMQKFMMFCIWERVVGSASGAAELYKSLMAFNLDNVCPTVIAERDLPNDDAMVRAFIKFHQKPRR